MEIIEEKFKNRKSIYQFIPKSFEHLRDVKKVKFVNNNGVEKNLKTSYLVDLIHTFMARYFMNGKTEIELNAEVLRKKYSTYYNFYVEYMIANNVITLKRDYCNGAASRLYSINQKLLKTETVRYHNTDTILIKKYKSMVIQEIIKNLNSHKHISEFVMRKMVADLYDVRLDLEKAYMILDTLKDNIDSYQKNLMSITAINQSILFHKLDKHGRFHTNFSVLKKEIRSECLTIGDEEIAELDITNSQPAFLLKVLEDDNFHLHYQDCYDRYRYDVFNGLIYDKLAAMIGKTRKECKTEVFKVFFGDKTYYMGDISKAMYKLYPELVNYIDAKKKSTKNHAIIAHLLQLKESKLVFGNIVEKIYRDIPNIQLFTVHDSIIFPKKHYDKVSKIFNNYIDTLYY